MTGVNVQDNEVRTTDGVDQTDNAPDDRGRGGVKQQRRDSPAASKQRADGEQEDGTSEHSLKQKTSIIIIIHESVHLNGSMFHKPHTINVLGNYPLNPYSVQTYFLLK